MHRQPYRGEPLRLEHARLRAPARLQLPWQSQPFVPRGRRAEFRRATMRFFHSAAAGAGRILRGRGQAGEGWAATGRGKGRNRRGIPSFSSAPKTAFYLVACEKNPQSKAGLA